MLRAMSMARNSLTTQDIVIILHVAYPTNHSGDSMVKSQSKVEQCTVVFCILHWLVLHVDACLCIY